MVSRLGNKIRPQARARQEGSPLVRMQRHLKAQAEGFLSRPLQSLRRTRLLLGLNSHNPPQITSPPLPAVLRSIKLVLRQLTRHLLGSPSNRPSQSNTRQVLRSGRHHLNQHVHPRVGSTLDKRKLSNRQPVLHLHSDRPRAVVHLDLRLRVLHLAHSRWHRHLHHSASEDPQAHHHNNLHQIRLGLVLAQGSPRLPPYSKALVLTLLEARLRRRRDHLLHLHRRLQRRVTVEMPFSRWAHRLRQRHHQVPVQ